MGDNLNGVYLPTKRGEGLEKDKHLFICLFFYLIGICLGCLK